MPRHLNPEAPRSQSGTLEAPRSQSGTLEAPRSRSGTLEAARAQIGTPDGDPGSPPHGSSAERMASLGRLAAGVAHEINNPLAYVLGSIELLERSLAQMSELGLPAPRASEIIFDARSAVATAKEGVDRIRSIIKDLTMFARSSPEARQPTNVEAVIDAALKLTWNELRHRVRVVRTAGSVPEVLGDEARLAQLFVNLFLNACRAIPDGRQGVLRISTMGESGQVRIEVEDDGVGIAPADLPYVFEPFFTTHPAPGGPGLGLSICRNLVTALGGAITVHSRPEAGTRFTVTLQAAGAVEALAEGNRARSRERVNSRARILIIDDEPLLGQTLRFAFQDKHDVEVAGSGREALARLAADTDFDMVLCDLMMPDVSGEHVYRAVSQHSPRLLPRFVFMTGGAFTERAQEFLAQFAGRQLEKPFNIDEVELLLSELAAAGAA